MGWLFNYNWSLSDVKRHILNYHSVVAHRSTNYGRHLWVVVENEGERFIELYLISKSNGGYGYKGMTEMCGPFATDCPLELLDLAPLPPESGFSASWREKVRKQASQKKARKQVEVGSIVKVYGKEYKVLGKKKRSYQVQSLQNGKVYLCSAAKME